MISVVIPVRNGGEQLRACLDNIAAQQTNETVEIVVVDSGSTDGSAQLAASYDARVHPIDPADFDHGATRNLGVRLASGDLVVFTSQDAHAEDEHWLDRLTQPLRTDPTVAAVYGRQLPHPDANPSERYFLDFLYGPQGRRQHADTVEDLTMTTTIFSNVNAAMRRETLLQEPFAEDIIMSEDQEWAVRMLLAGDDIIYEPDAAVRHSHVYSLRQAFRRFFDSGVSAERTYLAGAGGANDELRRSTWRYAWGEIRWLQQTGQLRHLPNAIVLELAKFAGLQMGKRHRYLPLSIRRRCSALPNYWDNAAQTAPRRGALRLRDRNTRRPNA
jgi:rhamnosyltransferase